MDRKWIGVAISVVLAALGTFVLVQYVNGADDRALEGQETVDVLVVSDTIPRGSSIAEVGARVETKQVPVTAQAVGSVGTLSGLQGTVTAVDLVPGEQVLASRFITPQQFLEQEQYELPDDLLAVTLSLSPERAVGGELKPGDLVAVVASFAPFTIDGAEPSDAQLTEEEIATLAALPQTPNSSGIILHKAIVTNIQVEELPAEATEESADLQGVELAPTGNLLVTLATTAPYVEKIVFTAEWGTVWLAIEGELSAEDLDQVQTRLLVYRNLEGE
jgi:pilus assembly protein CpaB